MPSITRRDVLLSAAAGTAVAATSSSGALPAVRLGPHSVSRLIVGGNPVSGTSHFSPKTDAEMRDYFTAANAKKLLAHCEHAGINTWQSRGDRHIMRLLNEYRLGGGRLQWIAQTASEYGDVRRNIREIAALQPIGVYHHGSQTDAYWKAGKIEQAYEALKAIRQTGAQAGLGTHIPEVVDYVESKGWDLDFYMTCVYELSRTPEEAARVVGHKVEGELFWDADREKMLNRVSHVSRPCLIFKVYGASRQCDSRSSRLAALRLAFRYAKPSDAVVIGMFPKHTEQVGENCRLVMEAISQNHAT